MDDPRLLELKLSLATRTIAVAERDDYTREAAVALLIRPREQLELLLIKRATHDTDPWSGHMAFPGGRREKTDRQLQVTAARETAEEVGITLRQDDYIGALDEVAPLTTRLPPILIAPFVFGVDTTTTAAISPHEVEAAVWVPLSALRDENAASEILIEMESESHAFPSFKYGEYVIWGLTHRILAQFLEITRGL